MTGPTNRKRRKLQGGIGRWASKGARPDGRKLNLTMGRSADPELARHVATRIVARLRDRGHTAYFAGGCVRDELLGLHPTDYDIATDATPPRVRELFTRTNEVGAAFGVTLVADDGSLSRGYIGTPKPDPAASPVVVEVATFRSDGTYTDARRPDSVRFSDAPSDAARRDFTINALFLDPLAPPDPHPKHAPPASVGVPGGPPLVAGFRASPVRGRIIDFVGGVDDLHRRVLRAVGDPDQRLREDHLRALRAVRFAARLDFEIDADTRSAITRHASDLRGVSRERIGEELRRMLTAPSRTQAAGLLERLGLDGPVLPDLPRAPGLGPSNGSVALETLAGLSSNPGALARWPVSWAEPAGPPTFPVALAAWVLDRLGALAGALATPIGGIERRAKDIAAAARRSLCLSNDETRSLSDALEAFHVLLLRFDGMRVSERKRQAARAGFAWGVRLLAGIDRARTERIVLQYQDLEADGIGVAPAALVTGDGLVGSGFKPGPRFKAVLDEVYDAQLEGRVRTKEEAMELARRLCV